MIPFFFSEGERLEFVSILLPGDSWSELQKDFFSALSSRNRPISTSDFLSNEGIKWKCLTTVSEATEILRHDTRFTDLGRFLFAIAEWGVEEREPLKELVVRVLSEASVAMTSTEILHEIEKYRSGPRFKADWGERNKFQHPCRDRGCSGVL